MTSDAVLIDFDAISEGDTIRVVRTSNDINIVLQGVAEWQDEDGDWNVGSELLTFKDAASYEEEYYLVNSASLPTEPGTLITYENYRGLPVFALKTYEDDEWLVTFPDGSSGTFSSLNIAIKDWTALN
jgi:hypothetical protein